MPSELLGYLSPDAEKSRHKKRKEEKKQTQSQYNKFRILHRELQREKKDYEKIL